MKIVQLMDLKNGLKMVICCHTICYIHIYMIGDNMSKQTTLGDLKI